MARLLAMTSAVMLAPVLMFMMYDFTGHDNINDYNTVTALDDHDELLYLTTSLKEDINETAQAIHDTAKEAYDMFMKYPNIGYLGLGYDPIYGNPKSIPSVSGTAGRDPGFRAPVFQLDSYSEEGGVMSAGEPDGVDTSFCIKCTMDADVQVMGGAFGYSKNLNRKVGNRGGFLGFSAGASKEFRLVSEMTGKKLKLVVQSEVSCCAYKAWIDEDITEGEASLQLHENVVNGVRSLPETWESEEDRVLYRKFIKAFGSHYIYHVEMGGRFGIQSTIDRESFSTMNSVGSSVEASASAGLFGYGVSFESSSNTDLKIGKDYEKACDSTKLYTIGGRPDFGNITDTSVTQLAKTAAKWMLAIRMNAMPIATKIDRISALINKEKFPFDKEETLTKIKKNLDHAIEHECLVAMEEAGMPTELCQGVPMEDAPLPPRWEATGVGAPVRDEFYDFERVGGQCAGDDSVMSGFHFQRGGCGITANWQDGVVNDQQCELKKDGLLVKMLCSRHERLVSNPTWHYTGVGSPVKDMQWMDRVGVQCPDGQVLSGLKFERGGCGLGTFWEKGEYTQKECVKRRFRIRDKDPRADEGLTAWARCSTFHMPLGESHWYGTGVGTPGVTTQYMDRVGGTCPPGEVARGFKFQRGGCNLHLDWRRGKLNYDTCDDRKDGQILILLCAKPEGWRGAFPGDVGLPAPPSINSSDIGGGESGEGGGVSSGTAAALGGVGVVVGDSTALLL